MSPQPSIAHYKITSKLGEGGMGEVWRATDTKLEREVAITILPAAFADHTERLARFQREAQVLASLNDPDIAVIHGVEERALVMASGIRPDTGRQAHHCGESAEQPKEAKANLHAPMLLNSFDELRRRLPPSGK
jgi:serine/threonine protein kinase